VLGAVPPRVRHTATPRSRARVSSYTSTSHCDHSNDVRKSNCLPKSGLWCSRHAIFGSVDIVPDTCLGCSSNIHRPSSCARLHHAAGDCVFAHVHRALTGLGRWISLRVGRVPQCWRQGFTCVHFYGCDKQFLLRYAKIPCSLLNVRLTAL